MKYIGVKRWGRPLAICAAIPFLLCAHAQADLTMTGGTYMLADSSIVQGGGIVTNSVYLVSGTVAAPPGAGRIESMSPAFQLFGAIFTPLVPEPGSFALLVAAALLFNAGIRGRKASNLS